jgi:hypothetical protein
MAGRCWGLGLSLGFDQDVPLAPGAATLPRMTLRPRATYAYQLSRAGVAVNDSARSRCARPGRPLVHERPAQRLGAERAPTSRSARASIRIVTERLMLSIDLGLRYVHRYALPEQVFAVRQRRDRAAPDSKPGPTRRAGGSPPLSFHGELHRPPSTRIQLATRTSRRSSARTVNGATPFTARNARFLRRRRCVADVFYDRS